MDEVAQNVPSLEKIVSEIDGLAESGGKYVEAPHVIEVTLPMLCRFTYYMILVVLIWEFCHGVYRTLLLSLLIPSCSAILRLHHKLSVCLAGHFFELHWVGPGTQMMTFRNNWRRSFLHVGCPS